jgi:hypothetical protein
MPDPFKNVKIIELMELFDDEEVTTADQVDRPERAIERQAIDDFMERNPRADGGRIGFAIGTPPRKIFIEEYKKFKGSDKEFANFLNKKYKTKVNTPKSVFKKRKDIGLKTKNPRKIGDTEGFKKFIKDFDGQIYKGFVSDQADKFNIDRSTAGDIIADLRSDIRKKLVEANYDITKSQLEGGKSYIDTIKERKDKVAKKNINTPNSDEFKKLHKEFLEDSKYEKKSNPNFAKYLNDKGKTAFGGKKFTDDAVDARFKRLGMQSPLTTESLANKNFTELKKIAEDLGIDTKKINNRKKLITKIYYKRASDIKKFKRATDPEFQAMEKEAQERYRKKNPEQIKKTAQNTRLKNAKKFGFPPPAFTEKEELWRSLFVDGRKYKEGRRLKTIGLEKYGQYVPRDEFLNAKILDTKTGKQITFKNLENYINKNTPYKYEKVLQPYAQKWFINNTPGLRTEINSKLIANYTPASKDNFFEIQHNAGRYNDPFDVSLTNKDVNLKESIARSRFDKAWSMSKNLSDKKKAFQTYTDSLPGEVLSKPGMVKRSRYFGEQIPFEQQLRDLKQRGVVLPRGTLKKAAEMSGSESGFIDLGLFKDIGKGTGAVLKAVPTLAPTAALTAGFGVDPTSAIDRASIAAEAAFAPALVQQAAKFRPAVQRFLNLGLSPQMALRAARIASPIGIASLGAEGAYQLGKFTKDRIKQLREMSPEDREELRRKGDEFAFSEFAAAGGGLAKQAGDRSGAMLRSMNPDSQGLSGLLKRGNKI